MISKLFKRKERLSQAKKNKPMQSGKKAKTTANVLSSNDLADGEGVWSQEKLLLQSDIPTNAKLIDLYTTLIQRLPPLSMTWNQLQTALDEGASAKRIVVLITSDPKLASQLLLAVNSAAFGGTAEISDIGQAVVRLGHNTVRCISTRYHLSAISHGGTGEGIYSILKLWQHGMVVSTLALEIGKLIPGCNPGEAATIGLLHDIGRMFIHDLSTRKKIPIDHVLEQACIDRHGYLFFEMKTFGCTHTYLGLMLAEHWKLPEKIRHGIQFHHHPGVLSSEIVPERCRAEVLAVFLANTMAVHAGFIGGNPCKAMPHASYESLLQGVQWHRVLEDQRVMKEIRRIKTMQL
ncbi:MAG: HDOD domain-containing protein [Mariprofundaceae bacterium]